MGERDGRAPALDLAGQCPGPGEGPGHRVAVAVHHGHQGVGRAAVVGEPAVAQDHGRADPLGHPALECGPGGGRVEVPGCRPGASGRRAGAHHPVRRLGDRLPSRAPAPERQQGLVDGVAAHGGGVREGGQAHDDARGAESALTAARGHQGLRPRLPHGIRQSVERGDFPAVEASGRGDAGDAWGPVDPHRAASALALGAAPVLERPEPEFLAQDLEQGRAVVGDLDVGAVDAEPDQGFGASGIS